MHKKPYILFFAGSTARILALLLFLAMILAAAEIRGKVITQDGSSLADALILHSETGKQVLSDAGGSFVLEVPDEEKIVLDVIHPDYLDKRITFTRKDIRYPVLIRMTAYIRQKEEVVVTAMRYPESTAAVPAAEAVMAGQNIEEGMPPNIAQSLVNMPGVSNMGAGGFSLVPNIRGLARRRILLMMDGARITSDRRTGPSASFISPYDIDKIEVLRSPSSVFYGSDAIGGVIHILTRSPSMQKRIKGNVRTSYGTANEEKGFGIDIEGTHKTTGFLFSFQGRDAENYTSPQGEVLQSQYSQGSLMGKIFHQSQNREVEVFFLGARGYDIGKANADSRKKPTWYPLESENFIQMRWKEKNVGKRGEVNIQAYLNPHFLETVKETHDPYKTEDTYGKTQSLDFGFHMSYGTKISQVRLNAGADIYGRSSAKAFNETSEYSADGKKLSVFSEYPYTEGRRQDIGLFVSADYSGVERMDLVAGIRMDFFHLGANPGGSGPESTTSRQALTGFLGTSYKITDNLVLFGNLSRAYRVPSLGELFYSGVTGRGMIIAKPDLNPETSMNIDGGLKFFGKRLFAGFYTFCYNIDSLIERYLVEPQLYTYGNIDRGRITGYELELQCYPMSGWTVFGNYYSFSGKSRQTQDFLNDVPPPRLYLGTRIWLGHFSIEADGTIQASKKNPGPAETAIPGFEIVNLRAGYIVSSHLKIYAVFSNIFNSLFYARPDPDSVYEPGRNFVFGVTYSF